MADALQSQVLAVDVLTEFPGCQSFARPLGPPEHTGSFLLGWQVQTLKVQAQPKT